MGLGEQSPGAGAYRDAMGQWLVNLAPWDSFATLTVDPQTQAVGSGRVGMDAFWRREEVWLRRARSRYGELVAVSGLETQPQSGNYHGHTLLAFPHGLPVGALRELWDDWKHVLGYGLARVEMPERNMSVSEYIGKYIVKDTNAGREADLRFWPASGVFQRTLKGIRKCRQMAPIPSDTTSPSKASTWATRRWWTDPAIRSSLAGRLTWARRSDAP